MLDRQKRRGWIRKKGFPQGLKPNSYWIGFIDMTEVMPCYKASGFQARNEFFRSV
jgi:hypothetical protein